MDFDLDTIGAWGSLLGGIGSMMSLLGILFAVSEIRRARKIVDRETDHRIYEMMLDVDRFFFENPELRGYIYDGQTLPDDIEKGSPEYNRIIAMIEMMLDFMECAYSQFDLMPVHQRVGWIDYFVETARSSPMMREFVEAERDWYLASFAHLILEGEFDPRLDKWDALKEWRRINKASWRNRLRERRARWRRSETP